MQLCGLVQDWLARGAAASGRFLIGLAGIPGSGKSTLAAACARVAREELGAALPVLPMDGFHYPNAWLETRFVERNGRQYSLREQKGCPESFDLLGLWCQLKALKAGEPARWPTYDRGIHEPIPGTALLPARGPLLVEGNYLLLDEPIWRDLAALFDLRIFLEADVEPSMAAIVARHSQGGRSRAEALAHVERCDRPNAERVLAHALDADVYVRREADWTFCLSCGKAPRK